MNAIAALSPYSSNAGKANAERHTLSVLVDNEPGVLARVVGLFSGRGYNIESLTVAEVAHVERWSRITIVTSGSPEAIEQISHVCWQWWPHASGTLHRVGELRGVCGGKRDDGCAGLLVGLGCCHADGGVWIDQHARFGVHTLDGGESFVIVAAMRTKCGRDPLRVLIGLDGK